MGDFIYHHRGCIDQYIVHCLIPYHILCVCVCKSKMKLLFFSDFWININFLIFRPGMNPAAAAAAVAARHQVIL